MYHGAAFTGAVGIPGGSACTEHAALRGCKRKKALRIMRDPFPRQTEDREFSPWSAQVLASTCGKEERTDRVRRRSWWRRANTGPPIPLFTIRQRADSLPVPFLSTLKHTESGLEHAESDC